MSEKVIQIESHESDKEIDSDKSDKNINVEKTETNEQKKENNHLLTTSLEMLKKIETDLNKIRVIDDSNTVKRYFEKSMSFEAQWAIGSTFLFLVTVVVVYFYLKWSRHFLSVCLCLSQDIF